MAAVAAPPSPAKWLRPATVEIPPELVTMRMRSLLASAIYRLSWGSVPRPATPEKRAAAASRHRPRTPLCHRRHRIAGFPWAKHAVHGWYKNRNVDVAGEIRSYRSGDEKRISRQSPVGETATYVASGDGIDSAIHGDLTNTVIVVIVDVDISSVVYCDVAWKIEEGRSCRAAVAVETMAILPAKCARCRRELPSGSGYYWHRRCRGYSRHRLPVRRCR